MTNVRSLCRVCLEPGATESLQAPRAVGGATTTLLELLHLFMQVKYHEPWLPQKLCQPCAHHLERSLTFKETYLRSHQRLSQLHSRSAQGRPAAKTHPIVSGDYLTSKNPKEFRILPKTPTLNIEPGKLVVIQAIEGADAIKPNPNSSIFSCHVCCKHFVSREHLRVHLEQHHYCHACEQGFDSVTALTNHNNVIHFSRSRKCNDCNRTFSSMKNLQQHCLTHAPVEDKLKKHPIQINDELYRNDKLLAMELSERSAPENKEWCDLESADNVICSTDSFKGIELENILYSNLMQETLIESPKAEEKVTIKSEEIVVTKEIAELEIEEGKDEESAEETNKELELTESREQLMEDIEELTEQEKFKENTVEADAEAATEDPDEAATVHYFVVDDENAESLIEITAEQAQLLVSGATLPPADIGAVGSLSERALVLESAEEPAVAEGEAVKGSAEEVAAGEEAGFRCALCGVGVTRRYNLMRHLAGAHQMYALHCRHCSTKFNNPALYEVHKMTRCAVTKPTAKKPKSKPHSPECPLCHKRFARRALMLEHAGAAHGADALAQAQLDRYRCPVCGKRLGSRAGFRRVLHDSILASER